LGAPNPNRPKDKAAKVGRKVEIPEFELRQYRPTPRHPSGGGRAKAIILLSLIVIVVVVVSVYAYTHFMPEEGNTPEEAFLTMVDAINDTDAGALVRCSVVSLADHAVMESEITKLEVLWADQGGFTMVVHSYELVPGNATPYIQESLGEIAEHTEATYSVDVVDFCAIVANYTTYIDGQEHENEMPFPFVKVGDYWYLAFPSFSDDQWTAEPSQ
jgi:hypothetical protein